MAGATSCRLCSFACSDYKSLYDTNGETSEVYQVAIKYFDQSLLDAKPNQTVHVICLECWQHISDFHSFQQWILNAQTQEEDLKFFIFEEKSSEPTSSSEINDFHIDSTLANTVKPNESSLASVEVSDYKKSCVIFPENLSTFECVQCKESFHSYMDLDAHVKALHSKVCPEKKLNTKLNNVEGKVPEIQNGRDKNNFKCETCGATFSQYGNLRRHVRRSHAVQPLLKWICKYCNKLFRNKSYLEKHKIKIHSKDSDTHGSNISHITTKQIVDNKENYVGSSDSEEEADQEFLDIEKEPQEAKEISVEKTKFSIAEISELGGGNETSRNEINSKKQIHMPALEIVDVKSEVDTAESDEETINNQLNSDSDERLDSYLEKRKSSLECPRCNQHAKNYVKLKEHFDLEHPDERCYINCCHITLYDQETILEHLRFHEDPNAFKCTECGKCFKGKKGLSSHKLQVHSDKRSSYHLHLCCCRKALERHKKKVAKGQQMEYDTRVCCQRKKKILQDDELIVKWQSELTCELCKANFPYYSLMRTHFYYEHPGEKYYILCCQRKMSRISDAIEHIRFHLNPHAYRCEKCNIDFSGKNCLSKHLRNVHTDSLPKHKYACDECDKTFEIRQILTRHKNVHHSKKFD